MFLAHRPQPRRRRSVLRASWLALTMVLIAACAACPDAAEQQALQQLWVDFENAFNRGDAAAVASYYQVDADRIDANGTQVIGRDQIQQGYAAVLARRAADASTKPFHATIQVRLLRTDVAILDGVWTGSRAGEAVRGHFTLLATKEGGRWSLAAGRDQGVVPN